MSSSSGTFEYLKNAVLSASPEQLQLMLLDAAVRYATKARECLERRDFEGKFNALDRTQRIVTELITGMRRQVNPSVVDQMSALYHFIYQRLVDANVRHELAAIDDALKILRHQRETWVMLIDKLRRELGPAAAPAAPRNAAPQRPRPTPAPESQSAAPAFSAEA